MTWWEKIGGTTPAEQPRPGRSVYSQRFTDDTEQHRDRWEPVGEIDPQTGQWKVRPSLGWERRAQGWTPLGEFLRGRDR